MRTCVAILLLALCSPHGWSAGIGAHEDGARRFVNEWNVQGPAHHCAVGVGHSADKIEKLGRLLGLETTRVC